MIFEHKFDREGYTRSKDIETLKSNPYLKENEIVKIRNSINYYKITKEITDISLDNGLYALQVLAEDNSLKTKDKTVIGSINELYSTKANNNGDEPRLNAGTATKLKDSKLLEFSGDVYGSEYFDGSKNININLQVLDNSHLHDLRYNTKEEINEKLKNISDGSLNQYNDLNNKINDLSNDLNNEINDLELNINNEIDLIEKEINENINVEIDNINNKIDTKIENINNSISDINKEINENINVEIDKINQTIEDKFENGIYPGLTVGNSDKLTTTRNIKLIGDINGNTNFDGSSNVEINTIALPKGSNFITSMEGYNIVENSNLINPSDNLNTAINKLENKIVNFIHVSTEEPQDKNSIWINPLEENYDYIPPGENNLYDDIKEKMEILNNKMDSLEYSYKYIIDCGERIDSKEEIENFELEGDYPELEDDYEPNTNGGIYISDNITKHLCIARGDRESMGNLLAGEFFLDLNKNELYLGTNSLPILVGNNNDNSSGNLTGEYLELTNPKGEPFKIKVNDNGQLEIYKSSIDKAPLPNPIEPEEGGVFHENWDEYKSSDGTGLCINQIYSGGVLNSDNTPVSHSFIELYNNSERDISLRGLSVQYSKFGKDWKVCPLDGILPGNTSYLIRCVQNTNPYKLSCRVKINNYDLDWNQELSPTGMKVALVVGTDPIDTENPYRDPANGVPSIYRYIDMLGAGGKEISQKIDYQEGYFARQCLDKNTAICRTFREGLKDKNDNLLDTFALDYRYADIDKFGPKCRADGPWDIYRDKIKLSENSPNMIFITFGKNQNTRIFTWQTTPTRENYLKLKKQNENNWKTYKTVMRNISHHDTSAITHTVKVNNLTPGIYIYKCGEEGKWSDEYQFEVFDTKYGDFTSSETSESKYYDRVIKILQTSDQQGWSEEEYKAWKLAHEYIYTKEKQELIDKGQKPNYHWRFNTGDASQNGNRSYEWRYYYDGAKEDLPNTVEMLVIGNNDLVDKKKSEAYTYYSNYEDSPYPGCYEFFVGDCHFLSYNTWAGVDTDYTDTDGAVGYVKRQIEWLKEKLRGPRKRWTIILTHVAPYTIVQQKQGQPFKEALEGNNGEYQPVDLVICGHNHAYSRSEPMLNNEINKLNGIYHVMCQATGYKLSGKEKPNPAGEIWYGKMPDGSYSVSVPGNPSYILWEITKDYIEFKSYMIQGIINKDPNTKEVTFGNIENFEKKLIDTFKIYHRTVRESHIDEL